ncbi:hypothetical protein L0128_12305 [candidate division KSB1 bacterium]|nr:hypothetical protein [candidate division KSB1 bacterium]
MWKTMKIFTGIFCLLAVNLLFSQGWTPAPGNGQVAGGLGYARIGEDDFVGITIRPELAFGKIGIGLNIDLLYNVDTGHIRTQDWNESYDYFRMLRYVRYGQKQDPFYTRIGALDRTRIGHGFLMNYYTNETANYDQRKIGLVLDIDFGTYGFESMTSNLGRLEIIGLRGYFRPLRLMTEMPIIKDLTFGASYVTDTDPDENRNSDDGISAWSLDTGLPLLNTQLFYTGLYYDFGKIVDFGNGQAFGIEAQLKSPLNIFQVYSKFERRLLGEKFTPTFFGAYYEVERHQKDLVKGIGGQDSVVHHYKTDYLNGLTKEVKGWYGELGADVLGALHIVGTYQWLDDDPNGILHLQAEIPDAVPKIAARATYDKINIQSAKDISLPNSVAAVGLGYKINPWMVLYMDYMYTFYEDDAGNIKTQKRIRPSVAFVYNFPLGK